MALYTLSEDPVSPLKERPPRKGHNKAAADKPQDEDVAGQARLLANDALHNVETALSRVHGDVEVKKKEITQLKKDKEDLKKQVAQLEDALAATQDALEDKSEMLKKVTEKNDDLFRALATEQAAFSNLKEEVKQLQELLGKEKDKVKEMDTRQLNEKNVRDELLTEIENMQMEINALELEKNKFQHATAEVEMKLKIETENFDAERAQWKEKQLKFLKTVQNDQSMLRTEQKKVEEASRDIKQLVERNEYLEHQLHAQERQIKELTREYNSTQQQFTRIQAQTEEMRAQVKDKAAHLKQAQSEQRESAQQLRVMSEKVFQLMNQMQRLEEEKVRLQGDHAEVSRNNLMLKRKCDTLTKNLSKQTSTNSQLLRQQRSLKGRLEKQQQQINRYKQNFTQAAKSRKQLEMNVRSQSSALKEIANKHTKTVTLLQSAKANQQNNTRDMQQLRNKIKALNIAQKTLQVRLNDLQRDNLALANAVTQKQAVVDHFREKDRLFRELKESVHSQDGQGEADALQALDVFEASVDAPSVDDASVERMLSGVLQRALHPEQAARQQGTKRSKSEVRYSSRVPRTGRTRGGSHSRARNTANKDRDIVKKLLKTHSGKQLTKVFNKLKVKEHEIIRWATSPAEFFKGLHVLVARLQEDMGKAGRAYSKRDEEIRLLADKNKELLRRAQNSEDQKAKAIMRLSTVVAQFSKKPRLPAIAMKGGAGQDAQPSGAGQGDAVDSFTFLTQQPAGASDRQANVRLDDDDEEADIGMLDLSINGIEDMEASFLASAMKTNYVIKQLVLRGNSIQGDGVMALVLASLSEKSEVLLIDLRDNLISLGDLETLTTFIQNSVGLGGVVAASLATQKGRGLVPYFNIRTSVKTFGVDLRHNPIFPKGTTLVNKRETLMRIAAVLRSCNPDSSPEVELDAELAGDSAHDDEVVDSPRHKAARRPPTYAEQRAANLTRSLLPASSALSRRKAPGSSRKSSRSKRGSPKRSPPTRRKTSRKSPARGGDSSGVPSYMRPRGTGRSRSRNSRTASTNSGRHRSRTSTSVRRPNRTKYNRLSLVSRSRQNLASSAVNPHVKSMPTLPSRASPPTKGHRAAGLPAVRGAQMGKQHPVLQISPPDMTLLPVIEHT